MTITDKPILIIDPKSIFSTNTPELSKAYDIKAYRQTNKQGIPVGITHYYAPDIWKVFSELFEAVWVPFKYSNSGPSFENSSFYDAIPSDFTNIKTLEEVPVIISAAVEYYNKLLELVKNPDYVFVTPYKTPFIQEFILEHRKNGVRNLGIFTGFVNGLNIGDMAMIRDFCKGKILEHEKPASVISIASTQEDIDEMMEQTGWGFYGF